MTFIKNKIIRFLISFILTVVIYFLVILISVKGDLTEVFKAMLAYLVFTFFLSIPIIGFVIYKIYGLFTPKEERSPKEAVKKKRISKIGIIVMMLFMLVLLFYLSSS